MEPSFKGRLLIKIACFAKREKKSALKATDLN
jgi:hypothetical protein